MFNAQNWIVACGIFLWFTSGILAQSPVMRNFSKKDGLPSATVYHVMQDSKGYLWFATEQGVSRYDGYNFRNFGIEDGLEDLTVFEIYEDYKGRIWFIPHSARLCYYEEGTIRQFPHYDKFRANLSAKINPNKMQFYVDTADNVYISIKANGVYKLTFDGLVEQLCPDVNPGGTNVYFIGDKTMMSMDGQTNGQFALIDDHCTPFFQVPTNILNMRRYYGYKISRAHYLFSLERLILEIDNSKTKIIKQYDNEIIWFDTDTQGTLWVSIYGHGVKAFDKCNLETETAHFLKEKSVSSVLLDRDGILWFTTLEHGVYRAMNRHILHYNTDDGLHENIIRDVEMDGNSQIWLAHRENYLTRINQSGIKSLKYAESPSKDASALYFDSVYQNLWLGTPYGAYRIVEKGDGIIGEDVFGIHSYVKVVSPTGQNGLLMLQGQGFLLVEDTQIQYNSNTSKIGINKMRDLLVFDALPYKKNKNLIATANGLLEFEPIGFINHRIYNAFLDNRINALEWIVPNQLLALGTKGHGLFLYDLKTREIQHFTKADGLSSNSIVDIRYHKKKLWLATNEGVSVIQLPTVKSEKPKVSIINESNGLANNEIVVLKIFENRVFTASSDGLTVFADSLKTFSEPPPILHINRILINGRDTVITNRYSLESNKSVLEINYVAISLRNPDSLFYEYQLQGIDTIWHRTFNRQLQFTTLPGGDYKLKIRAKAYRGGYSEAKTIDLFVKPALMQRTWFLILLGVLALVVMVFIIILIRWDYKRKALIMNEYYKFRQLALAQQMKPHFIFNALNSIRGFMSTNDRERADKMIDKFAGLMRKVLNTLGSHLVSLEEDVEALEDYLKVESLRYADGFTYEIEISPQIDPFDTLIPTLFVQPYVENAIWHGILPTNRGGHISIKYHADSGFIHCSVEDNGQGRAQAQKKMSDQNTRHRSKAIQINNDRVTAFNRMYKQKMRVEFTDLYNSVNQPIGTRVDIWFPDNLEQ